MAVENRNEHKPWFDVTGLRHPNWMEVPDRGCPPDPLPRGLSEGCFRVSEQEGKLKKKHGIIRTPSYVAFSN